MKDRPRRLFEPWPDAPPPGLPPLSQWKREPPASWKGCPRRVKSYHLVKSDPRRGSYLSVSLNAKCEGGKLLGYEAAFHHHPRSLVFLHEGAGAYSLISRRDLRGKPFRTPGRAKEAAERWMRDHWGTSEEPYTFAGVRR